MLRVTCWFARASAHAIVILLLSIVFQPGSRCDLSNHVGLYPSCRISNVSLVLTYIINNDLRQKGKRKKEMESNISRSIVNASDF